MVHQLIKEMNLRLQELSKQEISAVLVHMADSSFGIREVFRKQYGSNDWEKFDSRIGNALMRSKKGMCEEVSTIVKAYPPVVVWLEYSYFGVREAALAKRCRELIPLILGAKMDSGFRAEQLWFFMDVLYALGECRAFEEGVFIGIALYSCVISRQEQYPADDLSRFENLMEDYFEGLGYQLKDDAATRGSLYSRVMDHPGLKGVQMGERKKIKKLARVIREAV